MTVELKNAGHIAGSAFVELNGEGRQLVFSGDLGNRRKELLPDANYPAPANLVLSESTYGDRSHRSFQATLEELAAVVDRALSRGGKVLIPSFALERAQKILFHLRNLEANGLIPSVPVYVDSPLTARISQVFEELRETFSLEAQGLFQRGIDPFAPRKLHYTGSVEESKALNELENPTVIIAGSGMFSGGRILHHLRHHLPDRKNALLIVGYQPEASLGHHLLSRARTVGIHRPGSGPARRGTHFGRLLGTCRPG